MDHSDCGWTCGCAGKTVKSLENTCHTNHRFCGGDSLRRGAISSVCKQVQVYAPLPLPYSSPKWRISVLMGTIILLTQSFWCVVSCFKVDHRGMADCRRSAEESFVMYCTTTWPLIRRRDCLGCSCRSAVILARLSTAATFSIRPSLSLPVSFFRRLCARVTVLCLLVHVSDVRRCLHRHREAAYPQPRRLDKQQTVITYTRHRAALIWQRAFCQRFGWVFFSERSPKLS